MFSYILLGVLFYLLYSITLKPMLSTNKKLIDTNEWDQEDEEFVEYEEVED